MKTKQLVAMAALALLVALPARAAEVVSSNIVGYHKMDLPENAMTIIGNQFKEIGGDSINIQDVKPNENFDVDGEDWLRTYDAETFTYTSVIFLSEENCGVKGGAWCDDNAEPVDFDIKNGQGVWIQSVHADATVTFAGEVNTNTTINLPENAMTIVCNPLPMAVNIQDIVPNENFDVDGEDWLRTYDAETFKYTSVIFLSEENCGVKGGAWCDDNAEPVDFDIEVGQGFWIQSVHPDAAISFPTLDQVP